MWLSELPGLERECHLAIHAAYAGTGGYFWYFCKFCQVMPRTNQPRTCLWLAGLEMPFWLLISRHDHGGLDTFYFVDCGTSIFVPTGFLDVSRGISTDFNSNWVRNFNCGCPAAVFLCDLPGWSDDPMRSVMPWTGGIPSHMETHFFELLEKYG